MTVTRRQVLRTGVAGAAFLATLSPATRLLAQETVDIAALMQSGPLPEMALGDPNAPVTIVEYASMTCTHCAHFHEDVFEKLKEEYIDTGKVYFVFREFPLDPVATAAFMLARCVPEGQYFTFTGAMFKNQKLWAFTDDRIGGLTTMAKQAGLTQEKFDQCLTNQELLDGVNAVKQRGLDEFGINSTPTFFINGEIVRGGLPFDKLAEKIDANLPS